MFKKLYPWQLIARLSKIPLSKELNISFDKEAIVTECINVLGLAKPSKQHDVYHSGNWSAISLRSCDGTHVNDKPSIDGRYYDSELMKTTPNVKKLISEIPGEPARIRIMNLPPNEKIYWHYDKGESIDDGQIARLHIPIITGTEVLFQINHEDISWVEGGLYYGDFSFPHRLWNKENFNRIHLVLDFKNSKEMKSFIGKSYASSEKTRIRIRQICQSLWKVYNLKFIIKRAYTNFLSK